MAAQPWQRVKELLHDAALRAPGMAAGYWYWCDAYQQYYPYVGACPSGWRAVLPR